MAHNSASSLIASGERVLGIIDSAVDAIVTIDRHHRILLFNQAAERLFGCRALDMIGEPFTRFIPLGFGSRPDEYIERLARSSTSPNQGRPPFVNALRADGTEFPVEASVSLLDIAGEHTKTLILRDVTERRRRNDAVRLLASIVNSSPDAIVSMDLEGIVTSWNTGAARMFGYSATEMLGQPITLIIPPARLHEEARILTSIALGEIIEHFETERLHKSGRLIPVAITASPIHSATGDIAGASKVARDLSHRKRAAEILSESEARYRRIVETAKEGVWQVDAMSNTVFVNSRMAEILGHTPEEMVGHSSLDHFADSAREQMRARIVRRREGERGEYTALMRRKDSQEVWVIINSNPLFDASGQYSGALAMVTDVTDRKRAEALLRASDERFQRLTESLPQLIWTWDAEGHCDFLSEQWQSYTGMALDRLLGAGWQEVVHPEDRVMLTDARNASIATGAEFHCEFRIRRDDGKYCWFHSRGTCQRDDKERITRWYGANTDVDEEKRTRDAQARNQKMEALGTLAGGIAHDFNNILTAIIGNAQLALEDTTEDGPARHSLLEIERASRRATDLVRRILAFSRQDEPQREVLSLPSVIDEALKLLRATVPAQIELRTLFEPATPCTIGDATQVHQILMNLVTNAAYAIGDRSGWIDINLETVTIDEERATSYLHAGRYARLTVADNGCGMERETVERIFDPFFTTKPAGQGTGLGLSVVAGIMKAHSGAVNVYSEKDKGSVFRLYFPATTDHESTRVQSKTVLPLAHGQRVLYIDDDEFLVSLVKRKLTRLGYTVTCQQDPHAALAIFLQDPKQFDVVVTDLSMPGLRGFDLAREMLAVRPDLPVIVASGYVRAEDQAMARSIGIRELVLKPDTSDDLGSLLHKLFKKDEPS